jgi:hypothetical protein
MKGYIGYSAVTVMAVAFGAYFVGSQIRANVHSLAASHASSVQASTPGLEATGVVPASPIRATLDGVSSFEGLRKGIASSQKLDRAQGLQYLVTASQVCEGAVRAQAQPPAKTANTDSMKVYNTTIQKFCSDFSGSSVAYVDELLSLGASDIAVAQDIVDQVGGGQKLSVASRASVEELVLKSNNPSAIYDAASVLASSDVSGHWQLGQDLAKTAREKEALPAAQWIASQMLVCDLSGGCGSGGLTTMIECGSYSMCEAGITVNDVLRKNSTPVQFELAQRVYQRLQSDRQVAKNIK